MILIWIHFNILLSCIFDILYLTLMFVLGSLFFITTNPQKAIKFYPVLY